MYFNNQWNEIDFDPDANNQENLIGNRLNYLDLQAGGLVSYAQANKWSANIGCRFCTSISPKYRF
ncbi:MAG: hypothetical protein IPN94_06220 [Sphingobacteriales bacterium]|nr:hypothetical protein [Sphingobacteriales bacterium]